MQGSIGVRTNAWQFIASRKGTLGGPVDSWWHMRAEFRVNRDILVDAYYSDRFMHFKHLVTGAREGESVRCSEELK